LQAQGIKLQALHIEEVDRVCPKALRIRSQQHIGQQDPQGKGEVVGFRGCYVTREKTKRNRVA